MEGRERGGEGHVKIGDPVKAFILVTSLVIYCERRDGGVSRVEDGGLENGEGGGENVLFLLMGGWGQGVADFGGFPIFTMGMVRNGWMNSVGGWWWGARGTD